MPNKKSNDDIPLGKYIDVIFAEHRQAVEIALVAVNTAILKSDASSEKRHEASTILVDSRFLNINDQLHDLQDIKANELVQRERIEAVRREALAIAQAGEKAIIKSEAATEKRFESVNEFRGQLNDQVKTFLPRETFEHHVGETQAWRATVDARLHESAGKSQGSNAVVGYMFAAATLIISITVLLANHSFG